MKILPSIDFLGGIYPNDKFLVETQNLSDFWDSLFFFFYNTVLRENIEFRKSALGQVNDWFSAGYEK